MMNVKNIIQQGEEAKYNIRIEREGFTMQDDDFRLTLVWGMKGDHLVIQKSQMMEDEAGNWLFTFPTKEMTGMVTAVCEYDVPDSDYADGFRTEREEQPLCFVNANVRLPQVMKDEGIYNGRYVSYERRLRSDVRSLYVILRDVTGAILRDMNGLVQRALKKN